MSKRRNHVAVGADQESADNPAGSSAGLVSDGLRAGLDRSIAPPAKAPGGPADRGPQAPDSAPPDPDSLRERHGPPGPPARLYGLARLRRALNLSPDCPFDEVCETAADELARLARNQRPTKWPDHAPDHAPDHRW